MATNPIVWLPGNPGTMGERSVMRRDYSMRFGNAHRDVFVRTGNVLFIAPQI